jgi:hypothetical protein
MAFSSPYFHVPEGLDRVGQENTDAENREKGWR